VKRKCTDDTKSPKKVSKLSGGCDDSSADETGLRKSKDKTAAKKKTKCEQTEEKRKTDDEGAVKAEKGGKKRAPDRSTSNTSSCEPNRKRHRSTSRSSSK